MGRPSKDSQEFRERAVRRVAEQRDEYPSVRGHPVDGRDAGDRLSGDAA